MFPTAKMFSGDEGVYVWASLYTKHNTSGASIRKRPPENDSI